MVAPAYKEVQDHVRSDQWQLASEEEVMLAENGPPAPAETAEDTRAEHQGRRQSNRRPSIDKPRNVGQRQETLSKATRNAERATNLRVYQVKVKDLTKYYHSEELDNAFLVGSDIEEDA